MHLFSVTFLTCNLTRAPLSKIADFTDKLQILDTIPILTQRIDVATEDIDKLKSDFNSLHQLVDSKLLSTDSAEDVVAISDKIQQLEVVNASLSSRLLQLAETQQRLSSDNLVFVVLKSIHTELKLRGIMSASPLPGKVRPTEPSTSGLSTNLTAPSDTTSKSSTSEPSTTALSYQQIIVSIISPSLAQAIIHSKIKLKKIHTSAIDKDLIQTLGSPSPLAPGLINVNEFSALRPESTNFLVAARNEVAAFRHHRAEK